MTTATWKMIVVPLCWGDVALALGGGVGWCCGGGVGLCCSHFTWSICSVFVLAVFYLLLEFELSLSHHVWLFLAARAVEVSEFITIWANHQVWRNPMIAIANQKDLVRILKKYPVVWAVLPLSKRYDFCQRRTLGGNIWASQSSESSPFQNVIISEVKLFGWVKVHLPPYNEEYTYLAEKRSDEDTFQHSFHCLNFSKIITCFS